MGTEHAIGALARAAEARHEPRGLSMQPPRALATTCPIFGALDPEATGEGDASDA